jgi:membrane protein implicated in regulation of membrane protease activity
MTKQTIAKLSAFISLVITFFSTVVALLSGGDLFFVVVVRFLFVFATSMAIAWIALTIISSVIITAARTAIDELRKELEKEALNKRISDTALDEPEEENKGLNFDYTSSPSDNEDLLDTSISENPEIAEFEPFKPRRLDADTADSR